MRKIKSRLRRTARNIFGTALLLVALTTYNVLLVIPTQIYYWFGYAFFVGFGIWITFKLTRKSKKYINAGGYVVLTQGQELEHRFIAKELLGRNLKQNEIIHHINGNKTDNKLRNLCLMDSEKHELFHAWLSWKKKKSGKYPPFRDQKKLLVKEYGGTLLERLVSAKQHIPQSSNTITQEHNNLNYSKKLFSELRNERTRLATEKRVPVYRVFDNKTLHEMSEMMPDTDTQMLQIRGVGDVKLQMYGTHFLTVIKNFKSKYNISPGRKKDSA